MSFVWEPVVAVQIVATGFSLFRSMQLNPKLRTALYWLSLAFIVGMAVALAVLGLKTYAPHG